MPSLLFATAAGIFGSRAASAALLGFAVRITAQAPPQPMIMAIASYEITHASHPGRKTLMPSPIKSEAVAATPGLKDKMTRAGSISSVFFSPTSRRKMRAVTKAPTIPQKAKL